MNKQPLIVHTHTAEEGFLICSLDPDACLSCDEKQMHFQGENREKGQQANLGCVKSIFNFQEVSRISGFLPPRSLIGHMHFNFG